MIKSIYKIGDLVEYNGEIILRDGFVWKSLYERLVKHTRYKLLDKLKRDNEVYYYVGTSYWYPEEAFVDNKRLLSIKYNLK